MKKRIWVAGLIALTAVGAVWAFQNRPRMSAQQQAFVSGEALVQFKPSVNAEQASQLISKAGAALKETIEPQRIYVVSFSASTPPEEMVRRFRQMPEVIHAEPNGIVKAFVWDLLLPAEVWAAEQPLGAGAKVRVAVIDTAIDGGHPALAGKMVQGFNFTTNSPNTQSTGQGVDWHGTASTGRILNGAGAANLEILPVTVLSAGGSGSWANVIKGINYAVDNGAQVINMSLGGTGYSPLVQQAIDRAVEKGVIVVAAAGNTGANQAFYPAAYKGVISVAATNEDGRKAGFSTYHESVDLSAPGDSQRLLSHGGYRTSQGTSFAAPFIAGLAAMLKSAFPQLSAAQTEEVIKSKAHAVDEKNPNFAGKMGAGFLNALDVGEWMADIRAGSFRFPWQVGAQPALPVQGLPAPAPQQPWLIRGKGQGGVSYLLTPAGEVVKE